MLDLIDLSRGRSDMGTDEFLAHGYEVLGWMAAYLAGNEEHPLVPQAPPGAVIRALPTNPPLEPEPFTAILDDFRTLVVPHSTHWTSPRFMGYFGLGPCAVSLLGWMLAEVLNPPRMLHSTSPVATELEVVTLDWLRQLVGLPHPLFGMLHTNSRVDLALIAALEALGIGSSTRGLAGRGLPRLRYYASTESHLSVEKAGIVAGLGREGLRKIAVDEAFRMDAEALERAIREDIEGGWLPVAVVATVGTTSTTSIDPVPRIADICERRGLWLHVDAAFAGLYAIDPHMRWILEGCDRADSLTTNPHKPLFMPFNCSVFWTRKPELLKSALSVSSAYLHQSHRGEDGPPDLNDYSDKLPHKFPALPLWMVLRYFGQQGIIAIHREHRRLAQLAAQWIGESTAFELLAPPTQLPVLCFRAHPQGMDEEAQLRALNERLLHSVLAEGRYFLSDTELKGRYTLRIAIGNIRTIERDVVGVWEELQARLPAALDACQGDREGGNR